MAIRLLLWEEEIIYLMSTKFLNIALNLILSGTLALFTTSFATAQILDKAELKKLAATASTPQDHERIAKHFDAKAVELEAEAKEHEELAVQYKNHPNMHEMKHPGGPLTSGHCRYFAQKTRESAQAARQMAADHRQMAKSAK